MRLRVLSYNIHKGFSFQQNFVLDQIKRAITAVGADLVFLQEVQGDHSGHRKKHKSYPVEPQLEFLADTVWPHHAYGKNAVYSEGHHGNALMSAYPFVMTDNIDISTNRFERRGLLHGVLKIPGIDRHVHLICIHLNLLEKARHRQVDMLCRRIEEVIPHDSPLIIAGDFNDWRETISPLLESALDVREAFFEFTGEHALSFPSWKPMLRLDRMYVRGLDVVSAQCLQGPPWNQLSDHNALYSELQIRP